jgi:hypothetical protein
MQTAPNDLDILVEVRREWNEGATAKYAWTRSPAGTGIV